MINNYGKNYIKIYFWKIISIVSGFLSLLIVVPHLSNDIELFGVYSFCISFTLYLTYADIGFLSAGQKYAAEAYARGNRKEEVDMLGFTAAILLLMIAPFSIAMIFFSIYPEFILNELSTSEFEIASNIFLILGIVLPFQIVFQRLVQSILIIRIKDYISLRIDVIFNLIKICSVFYFFRDGYYLIVEYYLFISLLTVLSSTLILFLISKYENYNFLNLFKAIKFNKKQFDISKKLAYSSLFLTIGWIIYYELDLILIGKLFGSKQVAIYAIGFTFLNFLRSLWNTVFSPYAQRFNHFAATKNKVELKNLIAIIIDYTFPLCVLVTVILLVVAEPLILFWVGNSYFESIVIVQTLIIGTSFGFIINPANYYFNSNTRYKYIYLSAIVLPLVFILFVLILTNKLGILGISISKSIAIFFGFVISYIGLLKIYNPARIIKKWFVNTLILSCLIIHFLPVLLNKIFPVFEKNLINLILLIFIVALLTISSYFILLILKKKQRNDLKKIFKIINI